MHRNPHFYRGSNFQSQLEAAQEQHAKLVSTSSSPRKVFWKEPSQHDVFYSRDDVTGQRLFFPSSVPAEPGLGELEPEDISDRIRRQIQGQAMLQLARELGAETFEEANDFQVEEGQDLCPYSGHEFDEQDETAVLEEHQRLVKETEERETKEKKRLKLEELRALQEELSGSSAPPSAPQSQEVSDS